MIPSVIVMSRWIISCALVVSMLLAISRLATPGKQGPWRVLPPSPLEGRITYADAVVGDRVMFWGGLSCADGVPRRLSDGALFDLRSWTWKKMPPGPIRPCRPEARVIGDRVLVISGDDADGPVDAQSFPEVAWYDPAKDTWQRVEDCPILNRWRKIARTPRGVAVWSEPDEGREFSGFLFDADSGAWKAMKPDPAVSVKHPGYVVVGRKILFWGGIRDETMRASGALFDMDKNEWHPMSPSPLSPRHFPRAFRMGSNVLLWGGITSINRTGLNVTKRGPLIEDKDGAVYNTEKDSWTLLPASPSLGEEWNEDDLDDSTFLIWGEEGLATYRLGDTEWKSLPKPGIPRRSFGHQILTVGPSRMLSYYTFLPNSSQSQHHFGPLYDATRRVWVNLPKLRKKRAW